MTRRASEGQEDRALEIFEDLKRQGFWLEGYTNIRKDFAEWPAYAKVAEMLSNESWPEDERITAEAGRRDPGAIKRMIERARRRRWERFADSKLRPRKPERIVFVTPPLDQKGTLIWASQVASELSAHTGRTGSLEFAWADTSSRDIRIGTVSAERLFVQSLRGGHASGTIVADLVALE